MSRNREQSNELKTAIDRADWPTKAIHTSAANFARSFLCVCVCVFYGQTFVLALYRVSIQFPWIVFHFGFYHLRCAFIGFLSNLWINWQTFRLTAVNRFHYYRFLSPQPESNASQWTISLFILPFDFFPPMSLAFFHAKTIHFKFLIRLLVSIVPIAHALSAKPAFSVCAARQTERSKRIP